MIVFVLSFFAMAHDAAFELDDSVYMFHGGLAGNICIEDLKRAQEVRRPFILRKVQILLY